MDIAKRKALTQGLSKVSVEIAAALRIPMRAAGPVQDAARALHREEQVGEAFDLWTDILSRRAAVLWILRSLYVRILEDRGLLQPRRILDAEDELFRHLAPNLGPTAYLRWVFRDLASLHGGLPELFAPQPAEVASVPDALSQRLIDFWRSRNPETGALLYRFDDEHFDSRLMGDLYQDLDPVVKKRYALLQTPDFVLDFILDETLTPAIAEWGVETVRVLDPACGSGHFLPDAFQRLVTGMRAKFPSRPVREVVQDVLARIVGIDLNDYACALARARLVMTALEMCGEFDLAAAAAFHPRVFWADALEQVEQGEQLGFAETAADHLASMGLLTPPEVRGALRPELRNRFHVVVGNPPYITEKDRRKREYHRENVSKRRRYISASGTYSLGAIFTERMLQLATDGGWVGEITADTFMKRKFGKALIERVLARKDLTKVAATSGANIPGHGTPTVLLFARNRVPQSDTVRVVMGKRGDPPGAAPSKVWSSLLRGHMTPNFENEFISVADVSRTTMSRHEWNIGGGGAAELKTLIEERCPKRLGSIVGSPIGGGARTGEDEAFVGSRIALLRRGLAPEHLRALIVGDAVRDWATRGDEWLWFPYEPVHDFCAATPNAPAWRHDVKLMWPLRTRLARRATFQGVIADAGLQWFEYMQFTPSALRIPRSITFAFKSTHNHFALDSGGRVFKQTAPVIKLPPEATLEQHLVLLAQLNSSVGNFWVRQVCYPTGGDKTGDGARVTGEPWEERLERDGGKMQGFPMAAIASHALEEFAATLDGVARHSLDDSVLKVLSSSMTCSAPMLREALDERRSRITARTLQMVWLQEELDWLCYSLYGVDPEGDARSPTTLSLTPGLRPFEVTLAQDDAERHEALARGEESDEAPTAWFTRHGWEPHITLDALPESERSIVQARRERTQASRELSLLEQPTYKRRWYKPDYETDEHEAMELWLDERIEAWGRERLEPFSATKAAAAFRADAAVLAVGELLTGRTDFDLDALVADRLRAAAVPNLKHHVFKPEGLLKHAEWEKTWEEQHKEDRGEPAAPAVPPKYDTKDYLKSEYWSLRGKLDVPQERFIAFTEVPPPVGTDTLYGWAGWTPRERAKAMLGLDEKLEAAGVSVADRHGLLYGVWFLLPYVAWESPDAARDFRADVKSLVGENGVTEAMLEEWAKRFPPPKGGKPAKAKATSKALPKKAKRARPKEDAEA